MGRSARTGVSFAPVLRDGVDEWGTLTQGFTLHPIDMDPSMGTPALGYFRVLPDGSHLQWGSRALRMGFIVSQVPKAGPGPPAKVGFVVWTTQQRVLRQAFRTSYLGPFYALHSS